MKTTAAVAFEKEQPLVMTELDLDEPRPGEVRVKMVASGVCHTDAIVRDQWYPTPLPAVLGHEGAGIVDAVGEGVTKVAVGGLVDRMETAGFVERRADERDARARRVFLTKAGQKLVSTIRESVDAVETDILMTISETELDNAALVLRAIKERLLTLAGPDGDAGSGIDV